MTATMVEETGGTAVRGRPHLPDDARCEHRVIVWLTEEQLATLIAACPPDQSLSAYLRRILSLLYP